MPFSDRWYQSPTKDKCLGDMTQSMLQPGLLSRKWLFWVPPWGGISMGYLFLPKHTCSTAAASKSNCGAIIPRSLDAWAGYMHTSDEGYKVFSQGPLHLVTPTTQVRLVSTDRLFTTKDDRAPKNSILQVIKVLKQLNFNFSGWLDS